MTDEEGKKWIDDASYEQLLRHWRFAETGDPFFRGSLGTYYQNVMRTKREADPEAAVAASKSVGWGEF
jgi:hypothetical protein